MVIFRNDYEGQEIVFDESDETIHYVIGEQIEYEDDSDQMNEYEYIYEEAEESVDEPPSQENSKTVEVEVDSDDGDEEILKKKSYVKETKNDEDEVEIKKEDETVECDICNKIFRTTAVIIVNSRFLIMNDNQFVYRD